MKKIVGFLLLLLLTGGCINNLEKSDTVEGLPRSLTAAEEELILSSLDFSYELFRRINSNTNRENVIVSPLSLFFTLGLPLNGAFGETKDEVQETMLLNGMDLEEVNQACESLSALILGLDAGIDMQLATALWHRDNLSVKENFVETALTYFDADIRELDPEESDAADIINEWVRERTEERIDHVVDLVPRFMILYLINAAYYQGEWRYSFDSDLTQKAMFYSEGEDVLEVDMMERESEVAGYFSDEVQVVDLPYGEGFFTMTLIMPDDSEQSLDAFISESMTDDQISEWIHRLTTAGTLLQMPKFKLEGEYNLKNTLEDMGMRETFERSADFYNINEGDRVYLSEARHKAVVRIDEKGREKVRQVSSERSVRFNRPFVFLIREQHSGVILFMGKVGNPVE